MSFTFSTPARFPTMLDVYRGTVYLGTIQERTGYCSIVYPVLEHRFPTKEQAAQRLAELHTAPLSKTLEET